MNFIQKLIEKDIVAPVGMVNTVLNHHLFIFLVGSVSYWKLYLFLG